MKKNIFIVAAIFSIAFCNAQEMSTQPAAKFITRLSFRQFSGSIVLVKALLNNIQDTMNFIMDTGSGGVSLDSTTCANFNINTIPSDTIINGMDGLHKANFAFDQTLHFPGLTVNHLNFHVNNYDLLSSVYGERIDGIIGYSFFSRYIVKINYDSAWIDIYDPGKITYPEGGFLLHPGFTAIPIESLQIKDARKIDFNFYFDIGAGLCFLMSKKFAGDSSVLLRRRNPVITDAEGMGGRVKMELTVIKQVTIGPYKFKQVPSYIYEDENNITSYPYVGGLIGNDLLRRFNIIFNYPDKEIYLLPNTHFNESFDYSYTGLSIYYLDGHILVDDVVPTSPADKAGLIKGDVLISVGGNINNNIQQYKTLLQSPGEKIMLIINRNGKLLQLFIKPASIL